MPSFKNNALLSALVGATSVFAHGHVQAVVAGGSEYEAFALSNYYNPNHGPLVGWSTTATDNGFVGPEAYADADIICHRGATNAEGHLSVEAGGELFLQWDTWPESHKGPVIDMLAACAGDCAEADKASLEFFKISEVGLVSGEWASDTLIKNGNGWVVKIPETLAAGNYVLRHEIIALHSATQANGAQNYPQCININVTGGGSALPKGQVATSLYKNDDAGITFNLYNGPTTYPIPGPPASDIATTAEQRVIPSTGKGEVETGAGSGSSPAPPAGGDDTTSPAPAPTTPVEEEETTAPVPSPTAPAEEEETTTPEPTTPEPTTPEPTTPEPTTPEPETPECPTKVARRARRAARAARRHARDVARAARL